MIKTEIVHLDFVLLKNPKLGSIRAKNNVESQILTFFFLVEALLDTQELGCHSSSIGSPEAGSMTFLLLALQSLKSVICTKIKMPSLQETC